MTLSVEQITGGYTKVPVIKEISFTVKPGEICGLIGLNGAGKSTTIKHIVGLLHAFEGRIAINHISLATNQEEYRRSLAFIPDSPILYEELTFREHIELTAKAYGQDTEETYQRAYHLVEQFHLTSKLDFYPAYFSKGMKQKVLIVCALMLDVPVYIIDEPFLGLDPLGIRTLLSCIREKKECGASIVMSTHVLDTAERFCDKFVILHEGKMLLSTTLEELLSKTGEDRLEEAYFTLLENNGDGDEC
ncbi:ABC-2 type transport system ATP-binding protein [Granulicatella balaenopterae]|uniref:ABC-2 type transport system ATP-binding protein n=1 Tax=Granulicatella balaenopterae TaxID=137733 RepID=A0A1H9KHT6_9LACT|nr:ABC transporter ATP-binding protein [Granulicatella balaenopterae]SEQ98714.1 ABC-2 type transport system ATP-binding protein [Granulicatella balaenopterae]